MPTLHDLRNEYNALVRAVSLNGDWRVRRAARRSRHWHQVPAGREQGELRLNALRAIAPALAASITPEDVAAAAIHYPIRQGNARPALAAAMQRYHARRRGEEVAVIV